MLFSSPSTLLLAVQYSSCIVVTKILAYNYWQTYPPPRSSSHTMAPSSASKALTSDILIIGAGPSGIGMAIRAQQTYGSSVSYEIIEKGTRVGGTWAQNTYPGCGCDVASHFYSFSFALNPNWTQKFSMQPEIQAYFADVVRDYGVTERVSFGQEVIRCVWQDVTTSEDKDSVVAASQSGYWEVAIKDVRTGVETMRRSKVLVSAVGSLSVPKQLDMKGKESFRGKMFHSAQWDQCFDWAGKDVVVLGNGCSATQFVPVMSDPESKGAVRKITQFSRSPHFLAERPNPTYSSTFKAVMRYVPLAMRLYRAREYAMMERDFAGFDIESGKGIRKELTLTNETYIKKMAPSRYWSVLMPNYEIGCKRKVMDTDYLSSLWRDNVELVADDPVVEIVEEGVKTRSGRIVKADAIVLAIGFATSQMLHPMEIVGSNGVSLNDHVSCLNFGSMFESGAKKSPQWDRTTKGAAQAYLGTCVSGFKNLFILFGSNTTTGHLSVIYTVECQMNFVLRLMEPILRVTSLASRWLPWNWTARADTVEVKQEAALNDSRWIQREAKKLVWSSGCSNWALHPGTGYNIMMYPDWQFKFWLRSVFIPFEDFEYVDSRTGRVVKRPSLVSKMSMSIGLATLVVGGVAFVSRTQPFLSTEVRGALMRTTQSALGRNT